MNKILTVFIAIFISSTLYASGPFTLTDLECVDISVKNKTEIFDDNDIKKIKTILQNSLKKTTLKLNHIDCPSLRITLEAIDDEPNYYLYTRLALREEVPTNRKNNTPTFALTYNAANFIESETIHEDVLQSVKRLIYDFIVHLNSDNEE
jgi:hypothetical protein